MTRMLVCRLWPTLGRAEYKPKDSKDRLEVVWGIQSDDGSARIHNGTKVIEPLKLLEHEDYIINNHRFAEFGDSKSIWVSW